FCVSGPAPKPSPSASTNACAKPGEQVPSGTQLPSPPSCLPAGQPQLVHTHVPFKHCGSVLLRQSASTLHSAQAFLAGLQTSVGATHVGGPLDTHAPLATSHDSTPSQNAPSSQEMFVQS